MPAAARYDPLAREAALGALLFFSGASALVYQVVWQRLLSTVFGVTVYATSVVLATFMAGLALGNALGGRFADSLRRPLLLFAAVEAGVGVIAGATPSAIAFAADLYVAARDFADVGLAVRTLVRLICSFLLLLPLTTLMGATLPAALASLPADGRRLRARVAWLYGVNTLGAFVGALSAGYLLIGALGLSGTVRLAAGANLLVALGATALATGPAATTRPAGAQTQAGGEPALSPAHRLLLLAVFGLSGFVALGLEVVWFRMLVAYLPTTTYAFTTMLATVLAGIGVGGLLAGRGHRRGRDLARLGALMAGIGATSVVSANLLARTYAAGWRTSGLVQACVVALLPASTLMGLAYPRALALWTGGSPRVGWRSGIFSAVNLAGAILGSLVAGFALVPTLGVRGSLAALACASLLGGTALRLTEQARPESRRASATLPTLALVLAASAVTLPDPFVVAASRRHRGETVLWSEEGAQATVTVNVDAHGTRVLYIDGIHQASDLPAMKTLHRRIGLLPLVLHPRPQRALVIGLAGGATAGVLALDPGLRVDIVELSRAVVHASGFFRHVNGGLLARSNVHLEVDDGRNHLLLTRQRYDVITADLIQPFHAGAGHVYSLEYFRLCRRTLTDSGLMVQWIGHPVEAQYKLVLRTFLAAFPDATLWAESVLVGSQSPLRLRDDALERAHAHPAVASAMASAGIGDRESVRTLYTAGPEALRAFAGEGEVLTDDRPLAEYYLSLGPARPVDLSRLARSDPSELDPPSRPGGGLP